MVTDLTKPSKVGTTFKDLPSDSQAPPQKCSTTFNTTPEGRD